MCGRFTQFASWSEIREYFNLLGTPLNLEPRYNIAPTQQAPVVRPADGGRELAMMRWGLVPFWAQDMKVGYRMINARAETVASKPAFRTAFAKRRCLVPATGFYEWQPREGAKQPYHIAMKDGRPFALAGLWERWDKGEQPIESFTIIVTTANDLLRPIHDRMPVILDPEQFGPWLDAEATAPDEAATMLQPYSPERMAAHPVSTRVNKPAVDEPALLEPVPAP